jgi:fatty acid desaturase
MQYDRPSSLQERDQTIQPERDIYFCSDGNKARRIARGDFNPQKKQAIRGLHVLHKRWNLVILLHYAIWLIAASLAFQSHWLLADLILYAIGGLSLSTLSVLAHESSHNLFTRNPAVDRLLGFFCGLPVLFSVAGYRVVHPLHHKFLHSEHDPDDIENVTSSPSVLRFLYLFVFLTGGNELTDTRTVTTHPALAFMMCNINYHLEHHLYPGIPWYNLPRLHVLLHDDYVNAGSSVYRSYAGFLWDVAKALRHGVVPGSRLIPSHIREVVCL